AQLNAHCRHALFDATTVRVTAARQRCKLTARGALRHAGSGATATAASTGGTGGCYSGPTATPEPACPSRNPRRIVTPRARVRRCRARRADVADVLAVEQYAALAVG